MTGLTTTGPAMAEPVPASPGPRVPADPRLPAEVRRARREGLAAERAALHRRAAAQREIAAAACEAAWATRDAAASVQAEARVHLDDVRARHGAASSMAAATRPIRVLVVDDLAPMRRFLKQF